MEKLHCGLHNLDIVIYDKNEENNFVDDNKKEIVIFFDDEGNKYLKRFVSNKCDLNCPTIKELLSLKAIVKSLGTLGGKI